MVVIGVVCPTVQMETSLVKVVAVIRKAMHSFFIQVDVSLMFVAKRGSVALHPATEAGRRQAYEMLTISRCSDKSIAADTRATVVANQCRLSVDLRKVRCHSKAAGAETKPLWLLLNTTQHSSSIAIDTIRVSSSQVMLRI